MKTRLKRINRGVVLTVITAIVFIICTAVSNSSFKNREAEQIREMLTSYVEQMAQCSVLPKSTEESAGQSANEVRKLIADNWEESEYLKSYNQSMFADNYYYIKSDLMQEIEYAGSSFTSTDYITSVTSSVTVTSIHKNSANGATATVNVTYRICGSGEPGLYCLAGLEPLYGALSEDTPTTATALDVTVQLYKDDGRWKIVGVGSFWLSNGAMYDYY